MRTFIDLLPWRVAERLVWPGLRAWQVRRARRMPRAATRPGVERRLFVDVSVIIRDDAGTGIQRVVREIARNLADDPPAGWTLHWVAAGRRRPWLQVDWPAEAGTALRTAGRRPLHAQPGDVFVGLDYALDGVRRHRRHLAAFRRNGGTVWFLVHDLLPLNRPDWFSRNTVIRYRAWLDILAGLADGFLCNSPQTEHDLRTALATRYRLSSGYRTQVLPMGHVIAPPAADGAAVQVAARRPAGDIPFALMVGTLEPRKGHDAVLDAFTRWWERGGDAGLVLVGRLGWQVADLAERIRAHPQHGHRLLWLDDADDAELAALYRACAGVIAASYAEGFGLPVIEALGHARPVLARDLPVFRLHEGSGVEFFPTDADAAMLAKRLADWLPRAANGSIVVTRPDDGWAEPARLLVKAVGGDTGRTVP